MKKLYIFNIIVCCGTFLADILGTYCDNRIASLPLGAELLLGNLLPIVLIVIILCFIGSIMCSVVLCIKRRNLLYLLPIVLIIIFISLYMIVGQDSIWVKIIDFYLSGTVLF